MKKICILISCIILCFPALLHADEGMWLPSLIASRINDMKSKGFKLTAEDLYSINKASLKDGIVRFGNGCTGEIISAEGLLLTNHHCGFSQIQSHSSVEHDYLADGFWAMNRGEELPNPGLVVTFLVRMEEVTDRVNRGIDGLAETEAQAKRKQNISMIVTEATAGTHYTASVEPFYYGNQYFLFVNEVYRDVRLVAAPPSSIGNFGSDTDNWMWPRHTGDFSIFRIYAGTDNKPADYSKDNVPYKPKKHFTISTAGVREGDFTMVYGFPARTQRFLTSEAVDYVLNHSNPAKIKLRTMRLDVIKSARESSQAIRIAYAAKQSSIANAWKKWQGESLGLERLTTIDKKRAYEGVFELWASGKPEYKGVTSQLNDKYADLLEYAMARDYYNEAIMAMEFTKAVKELEQMWYEPVEELPDALVTFYKDYYPDIDQQISQMLLKEYLARMPEKFIPSVVREQIRLQGGSKEYIKWLFANTFVTSRERLQAVLDSSTHLANAMENDPAVVFYREFKKMYDGNISKVVGTSNRSIDSLYKIYVRGQMLFERETAAGRNFFPDANSTLRVAYGHIEGYSPEDAVRYLPVSTVKGVMEKDNPEVYDYNVPQRLRDIYAAGDYGRWAPATAKGHTGKPTMPVCFIATNHTTGGNSGSPVLNGHGELVGINFDRTWLSTMSDIEFDPAMCRNISTDIRYILFVIDKIGNAGYLINEMTLK